MTNAMSIAPAALESFEARAQSEGVLDAEGFFTQDDWEFQLDTLSDKSRAALEAHLDEGPSDHDTAVFLKGYLMNSRDVSFTSFDN